jgi:hypothetical protein
MGEAVPTRMVEFGARSARFLEVIQELLEGSQSYLGLAAKLYLGLAVALWDIGIDPLRQMFHVVPDRLREDMPSGWKKSHAH